MHAIRDQLQLAADHAGTPAASTQRILAASVTDSTVTEVASNLAGDCIKLLLLQGACALRGARPHSAVGADHGRGITRSARKGMALLVLKYSSTQAGLGLESKCSNMPWPCGLCAAHLSQASLGASNRPRRQSCRECTMHADCVCPWFHCQSGCFWPVNRFHHVSAAAAAMRCDGSPALPGVCNIS